ncbi:T-cell activation Rho GTPase-activating protein-like [Meriones unguiculatus]|uniref:T-cell activation Rho GTPase-activating protein-like n=1 Tax=Meriones unguiculatus TaxID=10047 RepID=UPI00293E9B36|nr:T-cell activation Rho GTPase-activating protein-like [Meriones unguiculatus]
MGLRIHVIMSNLENTSRSQRSRNCPDFSNLTGQNMEDLNTAAQGQFALNPRDQSRSQQQNVTEKKKGNRGRSFITRIFHRGSAAHRDQVSPTLTVTKRGKFFGNDLPVICEDGQLPTAILDMLSLINEKGPVTEGVFRMPASASKCQTLKEKLDSGEEVNLNKECVLVVASVLKEFLQSIKGSVLTARLYDKWLDIPGQVNEEVKVAEAQSLLEQLPHANAVLLRLLFRMLHNIERNSTVNQMTAYNLSVCMTPSILCLPSSCNSGLANDISKETSLVKFLIENCLQIFGEEMVLCHDESSVPCREVGRASCSLNISVTDFGEMKDNGYQDNSYESGRTCPISNDAVPMNPTTPLHSEGIRDFGKPIKRSCIKPMITSGSSTSQDNVCMTLPATKKGRLFGKSLMSVCEDGNLPAPILDMLAIIDEKGPGTERIFRTLANESYRVLKESLDSGEEMNLREEPVLIVASVLKEFIRNIQGSLLCSNLYEKWLDIPDQEFQDQKITAIQSLLQQMPEPNVLLLRHLLSVLHKIKSHSSINHMNAYGLSVRIAPNILWKPTSFNTGLGNNISKKISIVEILIENFLEIFGEDAAVFYGASPKSFNDIEKALGSLNNVAEFDEMRSASGNNRGCHSERTCPQEKDEESLSAPP